MCSCIPVNTASEYALPGTMRGLNHRTTPVDVLEERLAGADAPITMLRSLEVRRDEDWGARGSAFVGAVVRAVR